MGQAPVVSGTLGDMNNMRHCGRDGRGRSGTKYFVPVVAFMVGMP